MDAIATKTLSLFNQQFSFGVNVDAVCLCLGVSPAVAKETLDFLLAVELLTFDKSIGYYSLPKFSKQDEWLPTDIDEEDWKISLEAFDPKEDL